MIFSANIQDIQLNFYVTIIPVYNIYSNTFYVFINPVYWYISLINSYLIFVTNQLDFASFANSCIHDGHINEHKRLEDTIRGRIVPHRDRALCRV